MSLIGMTDREFNFAVRAASKLPRPRQGIVKDDICARCRGLGDVIDRETKTPIPCPRCLGAGK